MKRVLYFEGSNDFSFLAFFMARGVGSAIEVLGTG